MKPLIITTVLLLLVFALAAQSPPPVTWVSWSPSGMSISSGSSCPAPIAGVTVYCGAQESVNGAAYTSLVGPQGPPGSGMTLPITVKITCPKGTGTVGAGFTSNNCVIAAP